MCQKKASYFPMVFSYLPIPTQCLPSTSYITSIQVTLASFPIPRSLIIYKHLVMHDLIGTSQKPGRDTSLRRLSKVEEFWRLGLEQRMGMK